MVFRFHRIPFPPHTTLIGNTFPVFITERIDQEIEKTREKIAEYQEKLKTLEAQKTEAENLEIVQMVRALRMTPAQLNAMLSGGMNHGRDTALPESNNQEATAYEE